MKYIRTKDEIRKTEDLILVEDKRFGRRYLNQYNFPYIPIKESKNLDELCDCFVIEWLPTNHKDIFRIDKYSKEVVKSCIGNNKTTVYGAIWTDKGLIYVAKMNDKGELELI